MRVLTGLILLASLPLQAKEMSESEQLAWFNYELAVAEAPGDAHSDLLLARMLDSEVKQALQSGGDAATASQARRAFAARAEVVAAQLHASVDAARDSDPYLLGADLGCGDKDADRTVCDSRRAKLERFASDNAFHGVVLMGHAWRLEDADGFLRAARLAAGADGYESRPAYALRSLIDRYRKVPPPAMPEGDMLSRTYPAEFFAMAISAAVAMPSMQHFSQTCKESEGELRDHCLAIARKMMASEQPFDIGIGSGVAKALGTPEDIARADARRREMDWLFDKSTPLMMASEHVVVAGVAEYFATAADRGEMEALRELLDRHGIARLPPADWTRTPRLPAATK